MMSVNDPAVGRAARDLFGPGAYVNDETIFRFEQAYNCQIERVKGTSKVPKITFNTPQDEVFFKLKWR